MMAEFQGGSLGLDEPLAHLSLYKTVVYYANWKKINILLLFSEYVILRNKFIWLVCPL